MKEDYTPKEKLAFKAAMKTKTSKTVTTFGMLRMHIRILSSIASCYNNRYKEKYGDNEKDENGIPYLDRESDDYITGWNLNLSDRVQYLSVLKSNNYNIPFNLNLYDEFVVVSWFADKSSCTLVEIEGIGDNRKARKIKPYRHKGSYKNEDPGKEHGYEYHIPLEKIFRHLDDTDSYCLAYRKYKGNGHFDDIAFWYGCYDTAKILAKKITDDEKDEDRAYILVRMHSRLDVDINVNYNRIFPKDYIYRDINLAGGVKYHSTAIKIPYRFTTVQMIYEWINMRRIIDIDRPIIKDRIDKLKDKNNLNNVMHYNYIPYFNKHAAPRGLRFTVRESSRKNKLNKIQFMSIDPDMELVKIYVDSDGNDMSYDIIHPRLNSKGFKLDDAAWKSEPIGGWNKETCEKIGYDGSGYVYDIYSAQLYELITRPSEVLYMFIKKPIRMDLLSIFDNNTVPLLDNVKSMWLIIGDNMIPSFRSDVRVLLHG